MALSSSLSLRAWAAKPTKAGVRGYRLRRGAHRAPTAHGLAVIRAALSGPLTSTLSRREREQDTTAAFKGKVA